MDEGAQENEVNEAISRLTAMELLEVLRFAEKVNSERAAYRVSGGLLDILKNEHCGAAFRFVWVNLNRIWRGLSLVSNSLERATLVRELANIREQCHLRNLSKNKAHGVPVSQPVLTLTLDRAITRVYERSVGRTPEPEEIQRWKQSINDGLPFHEFMLLFDASDGAQKQRKASEVLPERCDGEFIQYALEILCGSCDSVWEIHHWASMLSSGTINRHEALSLIFNKGVKLQERRGTVPHDGLSCHIMGTSSTISVDEWNKRAEKIKTQHALPKDREYIHKFHIRSAPRFLVTAITSLYRGGQFIEQFMDNISSQSIFDDYCELVIVDADSPEGEFEVIQRYLNKHKNITYKRINYRIGIYEAWNVCAESARGEYLTNANLDDLRRKDSFERQAAVLDNLPFVDVTYQDLFYTFDPALSFEKIAAFGYKTNLPIITPYNMFRMNPPHNAPMWRKSLHSELGYFNPQFKSAGDYEFWMRCVAAGKNFYKLNDPHVAYYQNPKGLSTRPDTRGVEEAEEIKKLYARKLISRNLIVPFEEFCAENAFEVSEERDRYSQSQLALRSLARREKYSGTGGKDI